MSDVAADREGDAGRITRTAFPFGEAVPRLDARRAAQFRRARGADRGDASHPGRGEELDFRKPFPARAELLHAAAGPGSAATRDLYRLAAASHRRRHHGRRAVHPARRDRHHGPELHLRGLWQCRLRRGAVLRPQGGGARHRDPGRCSRRQAGIAQPGHDRASPRSAFIAIFFFNAPFPVIIIAAGAHWLLSAHGSGGRSSRPLEHGGKNTAAIDSMLGDELPDHVRPNVGALVRVAAVWLRSGWSRSRDCSSRSGPDQRLQPDRDLLQQDGDGDVWRRLRGAGLRRAAGGRTLSLGATARDAGRPRHGRDHARTAHHGAAVRRLHGRVS